MPVKSEIQETISSWTSCTTDMVRFSEQVSCFVRVHTCEVILASFWAPEKIGIFHPEALVTMNGPGSTCTRSDWYDGLYPLQRLANIRSAVIHGQRRRVCNKALSATGMFSFPLAL